MSPDDSAAFDAAMPAIARRLAAQDGRLLVVGLCGAQGSGKSTLAARLVDHFNAQGMASAVLSLDDLYLTRAERQALARDVHPLLVTRGVPGTHDVALGISVLAALRAGQATRLPRFDKARDDRLPESAWSLVAAGLRLLVFEGWCVGARAEMAAALDVPVNALERDEDRAGIWRGYANAALAGPYQALFGYVDMQLLLAAPAFAVVCDWRREQEQALRAHAAPDAPGLMTDAAIARFVAHYERLTRHILVEMPGRADLTLHLAPDRRVTRVSPQATD